MTENLPTKLFIEWVNDNKHRFNHPLTNIQRTKKNIDFKFSGVNQKIEGFMSNNGNLSITSTYLDYDGEEDNDTVFELDIEFKKDEQGFYCGLCRDGFKNGWSKNKPESFSSIEHLLEVHTFEALLQWSNTALNSSNRLCIDDSSVRIFPNDEIPQKEWVDILPIVIS